MSCLSIDGVQTAWGPSSPLRSEAGEELRGGGNAVQSEGRRVCKFINVEACWEHSGEFMKRFPWGSAKCPRDYLYSLIEYSLYLLNQANAFLGGAPHLTPI